MNDNDSRGWILLYRDIWDNPLWSPNRQMNDAFDIRSAWIDLLLMANYEDKEVVYGKKVIKIRRGQTLTSYRHLAERWNWSKNTVVRYIGLLCDMGQVTKLGTQSGTLLTIVNYDKFQNRWDTKWDTKGTQSGTQAGQGVVTTKEYKRNSKEVKEIKGPPEDMDDGPVIGPGGMVYE